MTPDTTAEGRAAMLRALNGLTQSIPQPHTETTP